MSRRSRRQRASHSKAIIKAAPSTGTPVSPGVVGMANPSAMRGYATSASFEGDQNVQFGPSAAPPVQPIGGDPRQFQYRTGINLPSQPFETRVSAKVLREIADMDWIVRKAIEVRKDEMSSLTYDIVSRDRNVSKARQVLAQRADKIAEIQQFFQRPDRRHTFRAWIGMVMEDMLVLDAVSLYKHRNNDPNAGPDAPAGTEISSYGHPTKLGQMISLDPIDGSTIKVLVDDSGRLPLPPLPAYQQYYYGYPRAAFTTQELIYAPKTVRAHRYYGFSAVEYFLQLISLNLNFWMSQSARWTDGTVPEGVFEAPPGWSLQQIIEYRDFWDSVLAGDPKALRKLQFIPAGMSYTQLKSDDFDETFAQFLVSTLCIAMDVTPMSMGYEPTHGGLGGKGLGETMQDIQDSRSLAPTSKWLFEDILNPILADEFDAPDLEWTIREMDQQDDLTAAQALVAQMNAGLISVDQAIEQMGGDPIGAGRYAVLGAYVLGEPDLIKLTTEGAQAMGLIPPQGGEQPEQPIETAKPVPGAPGGTGAADSENPPEKAPAVASPDSHENATEAQDEREDDITASKSAQTPELASVHAPLGTHGLWGSKVEQLPAYIQNIAHALIRDGHKESEAIELAVGAVKRWASGGDKVSPEVRTASAAAVTEWEKLRAEHAGGDDKKTVGADLLKVGPKGYIHGWIFVGAPSVGDEVTHPQLGHGKVSDVGDGHVSVHFDSGKDHAFDRKDAEDDAEDHFEPLSASNGEFSDAMDILNGTGVVRSPGKASAAAARAKKATDPASYKKLDAAIKHWTGHHLNSMAGISAGKYSDTVKTLINATDQSKPVAPELYRGMTVNWAKYRDQIKPGSTMNIPMASFTDQYKMAIGYSTEGKGDQSVVLKVASGSKAAHVSPLSQHISESEWIGSGSYKVSDVSRDNQGRVIVTLDQMGTFHFTKSGENNLPSLLSVKGADKLMDSDGEEPKFDPELIEDFFVGPRMVDEGDGDDKKRAAVVDQELRQWQTKAMRAVRLGKPATVKFETSVLQPDLADAIRSRLAIAKRAEDVKAAFSDAELRRDVLGRLEAQIDAELVARV